MEKREPLKNWTPVEIRDAIKAVGVTVDELAKEFGVNKSLLYHAMKSDGYGPYEEIIAACLGLSVKDIWPVRVAARQEKAERREKALLEVRALAARQVA